LKGYLLLLVLTISLFGENQKIVEMLIKHYPQVLEVKDNFVFFINGEKLIFDDGKSKSKKELLEDSDVEDMFFEEYPKEQILDGDPGRYRSSDFFKNIYGKTKEEIEKNIVRIEWFDGTKIGVTTINGVHKKLQKISREISKLPEEIKEVAKKPAGGYYFRYIKGTKRLSMHSFGAAFDLNRNVGEYWLEDAHDKSNLTCCKKQIPKEIVEIFEREGFIWGGKWYSFDTIHFEYRPELLEQSAQNSIL